MECMKIHTKIWNFSRILRDQKNINNEIKGKYQSWTWQWYKQIDQALNSKILPRAGNTSLTSILAVFSTVVLVCVCVCSCVCVRCICVSACHCVKWENVKGFTGLQAVRPTHNPPCRHTYLSPPIPSTVSTEVCVWGFGLLVQHAHSTSQNGHLSLGLSTSQQILFCCSQQELMP